MCYYRVDSQRPGCCAGLNPISKVTSDPAEYPMNPDDPVCLCFHVTRRKVVNFIRVEKPRRPSQLSQCFGAGTGCGWCRPYLERILASEINANSEQESASTDASDSRLNPMTPQEYARQRAAYVKSGGGTPPPGATPVEDPPDPAR